MSDPAPPMISVCIANYNGERLLGACIASVQAQEGAPSFEIIVHDDASTDRSLELIAGREGLTLIDSQHNAGFCAANNRMAAAARGRFLLLLNNDAQLLPDALATLFGASARLAHRAVLGLPHLAPDGRLLDRGSRLDPFANPVPITGTDPGPPAMVFGACLWIPRECWFALGGLPDFFFMNVEDMYLCCRARMAGLEVQVPALSGFRHIGGASFGAGAGHDARATSTVQRRYLSERNKMLVMGVFLPLPLLALLLPLHLVLLALEGCIVGLHNRSAALIRDVYLHAVRDAAAQWRRVASERRTVAASRQISVRDFLSRFSPWPRKLTMARTLGLPVVRQGGPC